MLVSAEIYDNLNEEGLGFWMQAPLVERSLVPI